MPQELQSPELQAWATGFPLTLLHAAVTLLILAAGAALYALITPHREIQLIREGNSAAAVSFGGVLVGLAIPLAVSLTASTSLVDIAVWGAATLAVQLLVFRFTDMLLHGLPQRIQEGELSAAALLVGAKLATALILAAAVAAWGRASRPMHFPRLPDWLVYLAVVVALVVAAIGRQERANAPPAPPPMPGEEGMPLGPASPFDPSIVVKVPGDSGPSAGTAFSVGDDGVWITARHVVEGCHRVVIVVAEGRGVVAKVSLSPRDEAAVLTTVGGAPALPLGLDQHLKRGVRGFHPGFPHGSPGEATSRLLGRENLVMWGRGIRTQPVLVWAEVGRTEGLSGPLSGLSGAPTLDSFGRVIGVTIAEAPRRGRIYTTAPESMRAIMQRAGPHPAADASGQPIDTDNYGRVADDLRRDLRVAQVICLPG